MKFIDSHVHYINEDPWEYIETLLKLMDEHDIEQAVLFGVQGDPSCSDAGVWHVAQKYPERIIPFACSVRCEYPRDAEVFLNYLGEGEFWKGVGEIYLDIGPHGPAAKYLDRSGCERSYPYYCPPDKSDNAVYQEVFLHCAKRGLPVLVHCLNIDTMKHLLDKFPTTTFIWGHVDCGLMHDEVIPLLASYRNLYCEIGIEFRYEANALLNGPAEKWLIDRFIGWQAAAKIYPERIIWGSDIFEWRDLDKEYYRNFIRVWEMFCDPLATNIREHIGQKNLLRIIGKAA